MANVFLPSEVYNEVEFDACADELSKHCASLVLEEPFISTFTTANNGLVDAETVKSVTTLAGSYLKKPMQDLKNQKQNLEEGDGDGDGENMCLDKENNLWMKSMNGKEVKDSYVDCRGGTGVFFPKAMNVNGVIITNPHRAYDRQKKKGQKKNPIKKMIDGNPTKSSFEDPSNVSLPEEWSYEYS